MGGAIKKLKSSRVNLGELYRPVAMGWQKWRQGDEGVWSLEAEAEKLTVLLPEEDGVIAVPARRTFSLTVWIPASETSLIPDLIFTQLDLHGLAGASRDVTSFAWERIAEEGSEVLVHATVLPAHLAEHYWDGRVKTYAVSPACMPLAEDSVSIWNEEGVWIAAVSRGDKLVYFQPLAEANPTAAMAHEVWLMLATLEAGGMLSGITEVQIFYQDAEALDLENWRTSGLLPVQALLMPPPRRPPDSLRCIPQAVREVQHARQMTVRRQKMALVAAAAYFLIVLALVGTTMRLHWEAGALRKSLANEAEAVDAVKQAKSRWEALSSALDPSAYPLEVLYQVSKRLPKDGVRLTLFSMNLNHLVVAGEAATLQAAQKFQEEIRDAPELAAYDWSMENPRPLPTGSAKFQINGTRRVAVGPAEDGNNESPDI